VVCSRISATTSQLLSSIGASGPFFLIEAIAFCALALLESPSVENMISELYLHRTRNSPALSL
jgi:hypothetical protein